MGDPLAVAKRILAVVSEPVSAEALSSAVGEDARGAGILVIAPALMSRTRFLLADPDRGIEHAEEVQEETVARLDAAGVDAAGDTGESDPLLAIQDALQTFPADLILLFTHPGGKRNWQEEGVVDEARERFDPQVEHMVVG